MSKYCSECGTEIKDNSKFCNNCGAKIGGEVKKTSSSITCPHCGSDSVSINLVSHQQGSGCLTILIYIILACTLVGIPIMILILLLKGKKTTTNKVCVCNSCGKSWNYNSLLNGTNNKQNSQVLGIIICVCLIIVGISFGTLFNTEETTYNKEEYIELNVQELQNDFVANDVNAQEKWENKKIFVSGKITDINHFFTDYYATVKFKDETNANNDIDFSLYVTKEQYKSLQRNQNVTAYCTFSKQLSNSGGITNYSLHNCHIEFIS